MTPPPGAIRHPLNPNAFYVGDGDGTVRVTMGTRWGRFERDGRYVEGTLFEADPELCVWVSAPRPASHHRISRVLEMPSERQVQPGDRAAAAECRDGRWAIAHRVCVHEWTRSEPLGPPMPVEAHRFRQGHEDRG